MTVGSQRCWPAADLLAHTMVNQNAAPPSLPAGPDLGCLPRFPKQLTVRLKPTSSGSRLLRHYVARGRGTKPVRIQGSLRKEHPLYARLACDDTSKMALPVPERCRCWLHPAPYKGNFVICTYECPRTYIHGKHLKSYND